jgi:EmrB/QacA subfamily drug resistance transporter
MGAARIEQVAGPEAATYDGDPNRWRAFAVISVAVFISILDLFIVNIAFPSIERDFSNASLSDLSWVLNAYAIVLAALLVPFGKLGDLVGRRRVFELGLVTFVVGSALSAVAPSLELLIASRVLQGIGAAALTPTSLGLILPLFPARQRATAIGAWAALGGVGAAMGPPLGGLLVQASWRWIFLVNIPLGLVTAVLVHRRFAEVRDENARMPDVAGSVMAIMTIGLLTLGLAQGPEWSWDERAIGCLVAAAALLAVFVRRSRRHRAPVLELDLFRKPAFSMASAATLLFFAGFAALLVGGVLFLTEVWHYSVLQAGFSFAPGPAMAALFAPISGRLADRLGPAIIGAPGGLLFAISAVMFTHLPAHPDYVGTYLPGMLIGGAGVGLILPSFTASAVMTLPPARLATGIGAETMFRQVGAAVGVATWVAIFGTPAASEVLGVFHDGFAFMGVCSAASGLTLLALALILRRGRRAEGRAGLAPATATP